MIRAATFMGAVVALSMTAPASARNERSWGRASSVARDGLVLVALGLPAAKGDWRGDADAAASMGAAFLASEALKRTFPETRPDRSDRRSFPSGHTSVSFAAAATLQNRYGWQIGLPAQAVAAFVGVSRVEARKHHWYDVVAGAAVGEASGFLLTSRHDGGVRVLPWASGHDAGLALSARF